MRFSDFSLSPSRFICSKDDSFLYLHVRNYTGFRVFDNYFHLFSLNALFGVGYNQAIGVTGKKTLIWRIGKMKRILLLTFISCVVPLCSAADYECPEADISGDCIVDLQDLAMLALQWLARPTCPTGYADCDANELNACEISLLTDYDNCGACGYSCADFPDTYCSGANCVPLICPDKWGNCDGNPKNGCETNLALYPNTCTSSYYIGTVRGDVESDQLQYTGHGSRWLKFLLEEADLPGDVDLSVNLQLDVPSDTVYELDIFRNGCTEQIYTHGAGNFCLCWNDYGGYDGTNLLNIRVYVESGTSCDDFTLTVTGNTGCDYCF
jgi:hypothetical protein